MRVGIGSYTYPCQIAAGTLHQEGLLGRAIELGAEVVQYCENLSLACLGSRELDALIDRAGESGIHLEVGTRGLDPADIGCQANLARRLGSGFVRVVVHDSGSHLNAVGVIDRLGPILDSISDTVIAIENHDRLPVRDLVRIITTLGEDRVGITLDTANSLGCLEGTNEVLEGLARFARCLHIKDVVAERLPSMLGFTVIGAAAGQGGLDIPQALSRMPATCESVILELWTPMRRSLASVYTLESDMASEGFAYLKGAVTSERQLRSGTQSK
jgi:sugar phosphate isomerase/epimerase